MIEARHTLTGKWLADFCSGYYMNRYFRQINIMSPAEAGDYPLLMLANHFSWWDGFIQYRLNSQIFGRKLYVMMLEEQLRKHIIMNRCGCFSIRKSSRSMIDSMKYASGLMTDPKNMVLIFPQGEIGSLYHDRIRFQSGVQYLMKLINIEYRIIYNINLIDYGSFKKPMLNIYQRTVDPATIISLPELESSFNLFYQECLKSQCSALW
ncbi:MAG: lysophospholipid acyltransferase family protein [Rikenellaceae bacterium]|nr:lysophospholipid acyltransferase family protein [Rikenellaceae bacterium]